MCALHIFNTVSAIAEKQIVLIIIDELVSNKQKGTNCYKY